MLGARIAALRRDAGWSQAELGKRLQVSASAVGMYEQGRREPSAEPETKERVLLLLLPRCRIWQWIAAIVPIR